jgi:hypothetical protein
MAQTDLYSLLKGYAAGNKTVTFGIRQFLVFISQYASRKLQAEPELAKWISNAESEFKREIPALVQNGKCVILAESIDGNIYLPDFCREIIRSTYQNSDKHSNIPFLNAASMKLKIPPGYVRTIGLLSDMEPFFGRRDPDSGPDSDNINPDEIIDLQFPQNYGGALMLRSMIPHKLMELALLKIHSFLNRGHNLAHIQNTLNIQIKGKERVIKEYMDRILYRPLDCLNDMERFDDFIYMFWVHFCSLVKNDIKIKTELHVEDMTVLQAVYVVEVCGSLYRSTVVKKKEIEAAFARLEELMNLPPHNYTLGDIIKFTNEQGVLLLDFYSQKELEAYIRKAISEGKDGALPPWMAIQGLIGERWFFRREHYLPICAKMISDLQPQVKAALIKRWSRLIKEYLSEPAMEKDPEYEKLLKKLTNNINPLLQTILEDPKLLWAYQDLESSLGTVPQNMRLFNRGALFPFYVLYSLRRKDVIAEIKSELPIWYSNPILLAILKFFKNLGRKKSTRNNAEDDEKPAAAGKKPDKMKSSALQIKSDIVPEGKTVDECLESLEKRWCSLRDADTRKTMIVGVKSLAKDSLRKHVKLQRLTSIKRSDLREIANYCVSQNNALAKLNDQEALRTYMELYMLTQLLR